MLFLASKETTAPELMASLKGGPGSGYHGHAGRPGKRGGSASEGAGVEAPLDAGTLTRLLKLRAAELEKATRKKYGASHSRAEVDALLAERLRSDATYLKYKKQLAELEGGRVPPVPKPPARETTSPSTLSPQPATLSLSMAKIDDLRQTFLEKSMGSYIPKEHWLTAEQKEFMATMNGKPRQNRDIDTGHLDRKITRDWQRKALLSVFGGGAGSKVDLMVEADRASDEMIGERNANLALDFLGELSTTLPALPLIVSVLPEKKRASYDDSMVKVGPSSPVEAYVHEIGHFLEDMGTIDGTPIWEIAAAEKAKRVGSQKPVAIERGRNIGGEIVDVMARPDNFLHVYMGRDYPLEQGRERYTELLAMGVGYLWSDPIRFAQEDPQSFNFTMAMLKGVKP